MASGIEIAGLVLGSIPLLVSALEHYAEGVETIERWWRYQRELAAIKRMLKAEQVVFQGTCERLLTGLVTASELDDLLDNAGGEGWKDKELDRGLQRRLGRAYASYTECVENMASVIKELKEKLELSPEGKSLWLEGPAFMKQLKRIQFSISRKHYEEALQKLAKNNSILSTLVTQNQELEPLRRRRTKSKVEFKIIQQQAKNLYAALKTRWVCKCNAPHFANLRLDARLLSSPASETEKGEDFQNEKGPIQFGVVFRANDNGAVKWSCQETRIRLLDRYIQSAENGHSSSPSTPRLEVPNVVAVSPPAKEKKRMTLKSIFSSKPKSTSPRPDKGQNAGRGIRFAETPQQTTAHSEEDDRQINPLIAEATEIKNFCSVFDIDGSVIANEKRCLGYLPFDDDHILVVYMNPTSDEESQPSKSTFLTEILSNKQAPTVTVSDTISLSRGDRFLLALIIASSVLQLCQTPWLRDNWNKDDIVINSSSNGSLDLRQRVFVSKVFPENETSSLAARQAEFPGLRNQTLFMLGIVLIELCLGQTLESLRVPQDPMDREGKPNILTDWSTATRLMFDVSREAGNRYGDAVRRCIYCDFDQRSSSLENDAFRQAVYEGVVVPLEEIFQDFNML